MYNKKVLREATKNLDRTKAPAKKKDMIIDPMGQWKYPGQNTRIPSNDITMQGVPYPVWAVPNIGMPQMMYPEQNYNFPGAEYVDEYPQMQKGGDISIPQLNQYEDGGEYDLTQEEIDNLIAQGYQVEDVDTDEYKKGGTPRSLPKKKSSKAYSRSLTATNKLFAESELTKKPKSRKNKIFDPNAKYYQDGGLSQRIVKRYPGMQDVYGPQGENLNIIKDPNYAAADYGFGNIEFIFPGSGTVNYTDNYTYQSPTPDKYTAVYNPRGANKHDVFLDMMHGMRNDPEYMKLLDTFSAETRKARGKSMDKWYEVDSQQDPYLVADGREKWDDNFIDGVLRSHLAKKGMGRHSSDVKGYKMERQDSTPEMYKATDDIYKYLKGKYEQGGFQDDLGKHRKLIRDWTYGQSIGMLQRAQEGLDTGVVESRTPWTGAANVTGEETTPPVIYEGKDVTVKAQGPEWARYQREYQNTKPWEDFLYGEQKNYLRKNKGLNKAAGVSMDNFPEAERIRIKQKYDEKMNNYVTRRLGQNFDFNPNRRGEWVDFLTDKQKEIVAGSKYGSKLQPDAWSRFMSGARSIYNAGPLSNITGDITTPIRGYTERENKEALNNWAEGMEVLAPLDVPGMVVANKMTNMNAENPSWYSGEMMGNVGYGDVVAMNPLTLLDIYGLPQAGVSLGRGIAKGSKAAGKYLTTQTPLKNAYNYNPLAGRLGEYNRVVGQDAVDDIVESGLVRVNKNAGVAKDFGPLGTVNRTTPYPSFGKAKPQQTYADQVISQGKTPYIISTDRPMKASTLGRHGKGKTQFPVDEAGKYMTGFPASEAKVYEFGEPHWLKGYKGVPIESPGLPNTFTRSGLGGMDMSNHVIKNVDYYTQLLNTYNSKALPAANRKFYKDLIANVKKQDGVVTERQLNELKRLATGNFDFGSKGYNKGYQEGGITEEAEYTDVELTPEEIDWYLANGYDLEELPDDYEMPMAQGGFEIQGLRTQPVKSSQPKPKAQVKEDVVVSKQSAPSKITIEGLRTAPVVEKQSSGVTPYVQSIFDKRAAQPYVAPKKEVVKTVKPIVVEKEKVVAAPKDVFSKSKYAYQPLSGYLQNNPIVPEQKGLTPYVSNIIRSRGQAPVTGKTVPGAKPLSTQEEADMYNILSENNMTFSDKLNRFMNPKTNLFDKEIAERNSIEQQQAKRFLQKEGVIATQEAKLDLKKAKAKEPIKEVTPKPGVFYQELGSVKDLGYTNNDLLSYRNQWDNNNGFVYIATPVKQNRTGKEVYSNVKGVAHFNLDASPSDKATYMHPNNVAYIRKAKNNNDYIPVYESLGNDKVKLQYKKYSELPPEKKKEIDKLLSDWSAAGEYNENSPSQKHLNIAKRYAETQGKESQKIVSPLRQMQYDDIKFDQVNEQPTGFQKGIKEVKKSDGQGTYLLFKSRDGYSRFSGGSVVFIFKDQYGNTIVRDYAGSLNGIENEGINIKKQYNLKPGQLTMGYHDVGSFSAKPKADSSGILKSSQWEGFNNAGNTGGALLIPND